MLICFPRLHFPLPNGKNQLKCFRAKRFKCLTKRKVSNYYYANHWERGTERNRDSLRKSNTIFRNENVFNCQLNLNFMYACTLTYLRVHCSNSSLFTNYTEQSNLEMYTIMTCTQKNNPSLSLVVLLNFLWHIKGNVYVMQNSTRNVYSIMECVAQ